MQVNRENIGQCNAAIQALVSLLGNGTLRGKKDAASALFNLSITHENKAIQGLREGKRMPASVLLQLCLNSTEFCGLVLREGAIPPLVGLSQSGTQRANEKAQQLLSHFRNQRDARMKKGRS